MDLTVLIIGVVEVLAMAALAFYGERTLPPDARISVQLLGRYGNFSSRRAGLIAWPVLGAIVFVLLAIVAATVQIHGKAAGFSPGIFLPILLCIVLLSEIFAIDRARRAAESADDPASAAESADDPASAAESADRPSRAAKPS